MVERHALVVLNADFCASLDDQHEDARRQGEACDQPKTRIVLPLHDRILEGHELLGADAPQVRLYVSVTNQVNIPLKPAFLAQDVG